MDLDQMKNQENTGNYGAPGNASCQNPAYQSRYQAGAAAPNGGYGNYMRSPSGMGQAGYSYQTQQNGYSQAGGTAPSQSPYTQAGGTASSQSPYAQAGGTASSQSPYAQAPAYGRYASLNAAGNAKEDAPKAAAAQKEKKEKSGAKKIMLCAVYGLVFGIVAGLAFFAIREVASLSGREHISASDQANTGVLPGDADKLFGNVIDEADTADDADAANPATAAKPAAQTYTSTTLVVTDVTNVVDKVMPSIVSIINNYTANYFYYSQEEEASGSGIIIGSNDEELLIVTNYHVIQDNDSLTVIFCDSSQAKAQVKGKDESMDLAVLAIDFDDLTDETRDNIRIATMGDSDNLKVGETAIAIGNSLGYGQSVTTGVVSALNREMNMNGVKGTFIQTDAAINPGNSGGALLNIAGEVIGINSNKIGGSAVEGMGYAIPISAAKPILEELMMKETRKRAPDDKQAYLGISGANITSQEQLFYGYPQGIYVASVYDDTAAQDAGIQKGDFIVALDGEKVTTMEELQRLLLYYEADTVVEVTIYRYTDNGYQELKLPVTLGNRLDIKD